MNNYKEKYSNPIFKWAFLAGAAVLLIILLCTSCSVVNEGHIGVRYQMGQITQADLKPGVHWSTPFVQSIKTIDIREQVFNGQTAAYTKDTQTVESIAFTVNYQYSNPELLIKSIGIDNVESRLIVPRVNAILKNTTGQYKADELIHGRAALQVTIEDELRADLAESGIHINKFSIQDLNFEDGFEQSIRAKVEAEQAALRVKNETATKEEEARQAVIAAQAQADSKKLAADAEAYATQVKAKAEAEAIRLVQEQLSKSEVYIEYMKASAWNGQLPQIISDSVNPFVGFGDLTSQAQK